ncbi:MAG TPA: serine/threonine-protein kinase [Kofleriaceae bacterium]|jgi:serine/threonine-protein kinase|nr:serine/threonine-protein kinase [Kofleriaceae bacterium]
MALRAYVLRECQPGDLIDGRYRIAQKLAEGGMGVVYLAEHVLIRRRLAIKLLHAELASDRWMVQRFLHEAAAAGSLVHPHIVESTDMGFTQAGIPYIVFEYLEGRLLTEEIRRCGPLPLGRTLVIARQIASALHTVHEAQLAHLDVKGDNVLLTRRGEQRDHAMLIDFGISRFTATSGQKAPLGILMGTPEYMAPEQVNEPDRADGRADVYALGVLIYEMLSGRCPFEGNDPRGVLARVLHDEPPMLDRPVPPLLEQLVFDGLLVKSPEQRLQTMADVLPVLDALLAASRREADRFDASARSAAPAPPVWTLDPLDIALDAPA